MDNSCVHLFKVYINGEWHLCPAYYSDEQFERIMSMVDWCMPYNMGAVHIRLGELIPKTYSVLSKLPVIQLDITKLFANIIPCRVRLKNKVLREERCIVKKNGDFVLVETEDGYCRFCCVDGETNSYITDYVVVPLRWNEAKAYMKRHRHNSAPQGHKYSIGIKCEIENDYVGVAIASEPKAPAYAKDRYTLEINRVCNDSRFANACSKLYAQVIKTGRAMGYTKFITYTLPKESGSSLKAVGFQFDGMVPASPRGWNSPSRPRKMPEKYPTGEKLRWVMEFKK